MSSGKIRRRGRRASRRESSQGSGNPSSVSGLLTSRKRIALSAQGSSSLSNIAWNDCFSSSLSESDSFGSCSNPKVHHPKSLRGNFDEASSTLALATLRFQQGKLYGRDKETALLRQKVWHHQQQQRAVVLVAGDSGVGKSALVSKLQRRRSSNKEGTNSICVAGKYAFLHQAVPFTGITEALRKISHILQHDYSLSVEQIKTLKEALGSSVVMLVKLVPSILSLLRLNDKDDEESSPRDADDLKGDDHADEVDAKPVENIEEMQNRFRFATSTFLHVVASWMPVTLVLDDMQWADAASFDLIEFWTNDPKMKGLVLVGCYRNNEVDDAHLLSRWKRDLQSRTDEIQVTQITLSNLDVPAVNEMIADVLSMDVHETVGLAEIVHKKTFGNPFFVIQYLRILYENKVLYYDVMGSMAWTWNLEMESKTRATENVVELMHNRMQNLPKEFCEILPLAACLGSTFTERTLSVVVDVFQRERDASRASLSNRAEESCRTKVDAAQWLDVCVNEGFIVQEASAYSWVHDKIEEAALSIVLASSMETVQYGVGEILYATLEPAEISENIFVIVNLLNKGINVIEEGSSEKHRTIANLNLRAGKAAMEAASFAQAAVYLKKGIEWLPENHWKSDYAMSLELYTAAAEAQYGAGDMKNAEKCARVVVARKGCAFMDKIRSYDILIPCLSCRDQLSEEASSMAIHVLDELGCKMAKRGQLFAVLFNLVRLQGGVTKLRRDDTFGQKIMTDESKIRAMRLMDKLVTISYHTGSLYLPLAIMKGFRWIVRFGLSEYSPATLSLVGLLLMAQKDFQRAKICAEIAMDLLHSNKSFEVSFSRTYFVAHEFTLHAFIPHRSCLKQFLRGYESGMRTGDLENACWNSYMYLDFSFVTGKRLDLLDQDWEVYTKQMKDFLQLEPAGNARHPWQTARNLMGRSEDPHKLKGDIFNIDTFESEKVDRVAVVSCYMWRIVLSHYMCDDETGAAIAHELFHRYTEADLNPATMHFDLLYSHTAIVCYGTARKTGSTKYLGLGRKCHKHIKNICKMGNPNFSYFDKLLDAELSAFRQKRESAKENFALAVHLVARTGLVNQHAVVNERFADFMLECRNKDEAEFRYSNAVELYKEWGAMGKVDQVTEKMALLREGPKSRPVTLLREA